jgi:carboxyl-terminal processing protease
MTRFHVALVLLLVAVPVWAAPPAERKALRVELKSHPDTWAKRERWIPLPADAKPVVQERAELKTVQQNNRVVVRTAVFEKRGDVAGISIREIFHLVRPDARRKLGPEEQKSRNAFGQAIKIAKTQFLNEPTMPGLLAGALDGVEKGKALDKVGLYRAGMNGVATCLNDKYSCYMDPDGYKSFSAKSQRDQVGCGVRLVKADAGILLRVVEGSPAASAGVKNRDRLISVDGQPVGSAEQVAPLLDGTAGSRIRLEVERAGARQTIEITRATYNAFPILKTLAKGGVGLVSLPRFYKGSAKDLKAAITALEQEHGGPLSGLVLDLRNNPGGNLPERTAILNDFIPSGSLGANWGQGGRVLETYTAKPELASHAQLPLVVLVNGRSASASERVAGVLKDRGRALIVGDPTFGKDIGQSFHDLGDGSVLKLTTLKFHLPSGAAPGVIQPDVTTEAARANVARRLLGTVPADQLKDPALTFAVLSLRKPQRNP